MSDISEKGSQGQTRLMMPSVDHVVNRAGRLQRGYVDAVANLNNKGFQLYIEHVPSSTDTSKNFVTFPAFLDGFSDAYNSEWNSEQVFGRMDPIATFRHTRRAISVSWKIPSASPEEAATNLDKVNLLVRFLYPLYEDREGASTINMGPLLKVKFGNLIQDASTGGPLLGYVNGITVDPILEDGMHALAANGPLKTGGVEYLPKTIRLNFEMAVLHEHSLGWRKGTGDKYYFRGGEEGFPYQTKTGSPFNTPVEGSQNQPKVIDFDLTLEEREKRAKQFAERFSKLNAAQATAVTAGMLAQKGVLGTVSTFAGAYPVAATNVVNQAGGALQSVAAAFRQSAADAGYGSIAEAVAATRANSSNGGSQ